jgi:molybdenum cofactor cytidylyltransferase
MIAGVLLAAGASSRFGADKRLHRLADGMGMALSALRPLCEALDDVIAVVRPGDGLLATQLGSAGARVVVAHDWRCGMGSSLALGVAALDRHATACLIALADMPFVRTATISRTAAPLLQGASLVAPVYRGSRGHPVGFAAEWFSTLRRLRGEHGARDILAVHRDRLTLVEVDDPGILLDIDYPDDLSAPRG